jgi:hypothetical protein
MAILKRYSSLARSDLIITEYRFVIHSIITECRFLIHSMPKDIRKLQLQFDRDPTIG